MNKVDEISQAERRRILAEERRGLTYMGHAIANADDDRGGRYAHAGNSTTVTGSTPGPIYPQQPAGSPWACDALPPEPPLGYEIDAQEPVGEVHERMPPSPSAQLPARGSVVGDVGHAPKSKRRI